MAISYRRMMRLDQILQSRFGWDIVYLLEVGGRDGQHYSRAGEKLSEYMPDEDDVKDFFDAIFADVKGLRPEQVWAVMGIPGEMPAVSRSSGRRGGRGRSLAQMFTSRQKAPAAPAQVAPAPAAPVAPTPVAAAPAAPDSTLAAVLAALERQAKVSEALMDRIASLEAEWSGEELPPKAEEPSEEPAEVQEEPAEEPAAEEPAEEPAAEEPSEKQVQKEPAAEESDLPF